MKYAGVGARNTPESVLKRICAIAREYAEEGYLLRSGGAEGADTAFMHGALKESGLAELYLPWPNYIVDSLGTPVYGTVYDRPAPRAYTIAAAHHPAWEDLSDGVRALMARNVHIVLGPGLDDPVDELICWTPRGRIVGGTGHTLRVAMEYGVPIINLGEVS